MQKTISNFNWRWIFIVVGQVWRWLTEPVATITDPETRLKSRVLTSALVFIMPVGLVLSVLYPLVYGESIVEDLDFLWACVGISLAVIPYLLARQGRYQFATLLLDLIAVLVLTALATMDDDTADIRYLMVMMLVASSLLLDRSIIILIVINLTAIMSVAFLNPYTTLGDVILGEVVFFLLGFAAILLVVWLRNILERQRTDELKQLNNALQAEIVARQEAEARNLELAVEQERLRMLERFVTDIAHDFRTPLTTMKLNVYLLQQKQGDPEALQRHTDMLMTQVDHLSRALEDMLLILRLESNLEYLLLQPLVVNEIVQIVVSGQNDLARHKRLMLAFNANEGLPPVQADPRLLTRAIENLIVNALHYTPSGGAITVRTSYDDPWVVIEVADTGVGIAPEELPHIFERFYRGDEARSTQTGKVGLGLSIAQKVVVAHAGQITVESVPDQGSVFRMLLPPAASE